MLASLPRERSMVVAFDSMTRGALKKERPREDLLERKKKERGGALSFGIVARRKEHGHCLRFHNRRST